MRMHKHDREGFTIVELLIVIVVIAILAAITVVAFNGIRDRAQASQAAAQLDQARKKVRLYYTENSAYPSTMAAAGVNDTNGTVYTITPIGSSYCISVSTSGKTYRVIGDSQDATIGACQAGTINLALNAAATSSLPAVSGRLISEVTNGITNGSYFESDPGTGSVTVDLGSQMSVGKVIVWHYYSDGRSYNNNLVQVSPDGTSWTTLFNSSVSGAFTEVAAGHTLTFTPTQVRYIRDTINGSNSNPGNHWVEIQAY